MDEFNFNNNPEIGTPISNLKNYKEKQSNNNAELHLLIKDLSDRLDDIETKNIDSVQLNKPIKKDKKNVDLNKFIKKETRINYIEIIIYMIIFILLNNKFTIEIIYNLPFIKTINSPYPNLILRTLLFGLIVYLYKKFFKKA